MEKGLSNHVVRQSKARQNQNKKDSPVKNSASKNSSLLPVEAVRESDTNRTSMERRGMHTQSPPSSPATDTGTGTATASGTSTDAYGGMHETMRLVSV